MPGSEPATEVLHSTCLETCDWYLPEHQAGEPTLEFRLRQAHTNTLQGKRINDVVNRMHVAMPKARDAMARPPVIPGSVAAARGQPQVPAAAKRQTERDLQVSCRRVTPQQGEPACIAASMADCTT